MQYSFDGCTLELGYTDMYHPDMTFTVDWVLKTNYLSIPICMCVFIRILYQSDCDDIKVMGQKCKKNCKKLVCSDCSQYKPINFVVNSNNKQGDQAIYTIQNQGQGHRNKKGLLL